jgi:hypothetical protein
MIITAVAALLLSPTIPENIDIGRANWATYARLETANLDLPNTDLIDQVQRVLRSGECTMERQTWQRFEFDVNYAVQLDSAGNATRIVVEDIGCRPVELLVGHVAARIVRDGHVRVAAPAQPRYYASRINFNLR